MLDEIVSSDLQLVTRQFDPASLTNKRILITGGAGFIGSWLCDVFLRVGACVTCVDNLSTSQLTNIDHLSDNPSFEMKAEDVCQLMDSNAYDYVLHFASRASPEDYQKRPIETLMANSVGTRRVLDIAVKHGATLLYASSSEVYGDPEVIPTPETYAGRVNPVGVRSCYVEGKRFGEALVGAYVRETGLDARIVRIFNSYGPRLRADGVYGRALSRFIFQTLSGQDITVYGIGEQTRSFCYITDTVSAIIKFMLHVDAKGEVLNIGNPKEISILTLAQLVKNWTGSNSSITFHPQMDDDPVRRCPDIRKAQRILNWYPTIALEAGLERTIEWFRKTLGADPHVLAS